MIQALVRWAFGGLKTDEPKPVRRYTKRRIEVPTIGFPDALGGTDSSPKRKFRRMRGKPYVVRAFTRKDGIQIPSYVKKGKKLKISGHRIKLLRAQGMKWREIVDVTGFSQRGCVYAYRRVVPN